MLDKLPIPSLRVQRLIAFLVILTQGGISVTGAIVRVTASGLGCPTWPQCFPGSFVPVPHAEVPVVHQAVEFTNRMFTFGVVLTAALAVLAVIRAGRRREVQVYAWLMPASTVVQAIIGGITVRTGLLWWTVAVHLLVSMVMVWLAVLLYVKIGEPDAGTDRLVVPQPLRWFTVLTAVTLSTVLITGTLVTGAGPHAGDKSALQPVKRLQVEITDLAHLHSSLLVAYLSFVIGLGFALLAVRAPKPVLLRLAVLAGLVLAQGAVGAVQFYTGVPAVLVAIHVAESGLRYPSQVASRDAATPKSVPEFSQGGDMPPQIDVRDLGSDCRPLPTLPGVSVSEFSAP
ncbi:COX15/CtaA family protein [Mycolicibacterium mucogenicum]|uniref:COX15/CtaA family protein n=1 Tax=Mycolicibacterium mucogenicum TaxID=56689 RepID=UPI000A53D0A1|nr:heme A synthase [Mycolicibacterium mucogenicum]